jgi:hypothetical protein
MQWGHFERLVLVSVAVYVASLVLSGAWRLMIRSLAYHPWRQVAHGAVTAFPTSRWQGPFRIIGLLLAWCFAGMVLVLFSVFVGGVEILFSPRDIYWSLRHR